MHWSQAVLLFCGSAVAAPLSIGVGSTGTGTGVSTTSSSVGASVGGFGICIGLGGTSGCGSSSSTTSTTPSTGSTGSTTGSTTPSTGSTGSTVGSTTGSTGSTVGSTTGSTGTTGTTSGTSAVTSPKVSTVPVASTSGTTSTTPSTGSTGSTVGSTVGSAGSTVGSTTGSTGATSSSGDFTTTQVNTIITDLNNFDSAISNAQTVLNSFTGGAKIQDQANAVAAAGDDWQKTIVQLLKDAQAIANKGHFSSADSKTITNTIGGAITTDLKALFANIKSKKALFTQVGSTKNVHDGLVGIRDELKWICDALTPDLLAVDYPALQTAGVAIYAAAQDAIDTYA